MTQPCTRMYMYTSRVTADQDKDLNSIIFFFIIYMTINMYFKHNILPIYYKIRRYVLFKKFANSTIYFSDYRVVIFTILLLL